MLQTSSCEDVHVASVSLMAALLLPTQHSEILNNGIHEYSRTVEYKETTGILHHSYFWLTATLLSIYSQLTKFC